ncbi:MAG: AAA family ATPase [Saprospiraceae bacterium]|nr:AAA family ATPase [Candidatus Opimibacter skivensis]
MKLTYLKILNYRNLSGQEIRFNPSNNFIVGENNLGKSNLLLLLNTLFRNTYRSNYDIGDFADQDKPIEVTFSLLLDDIEIGLFDDLFDSDETNNHITVRAIQASPDDNVEYWHDETNQKIPASSIKCINYLYYDSQRNPDKELTFDKSKGVGRFLNHLVQRYLTKEEVGELDFVDENKVAGLIKEVNLTLCKIKAFKDYNINASLEQTIEDLLAKLILLKDSDDRHLNQSGYGVQFLAVISLFILEKLLNIGKIKSKKGVFGDAESKSISLVVGLDEPEIHLHPFLQRSLIKYIHKIINNQDADFTDILKDAFGINSIIGQTIIATHSPSILLNKYTEIVRLYIKEGKLRIKSGSEIQLDAALQKHLQMQFPFIKEAFLLVL